jgi:hypothetical protein
MDATDTAHSIDVSALQTRASPATGQRHGHDRR